MNYSNWASSFAAHLRRVLIEYTNNYYNIARPHQGINQRTPLPRGQPSTSGTIHNRKLLGGIINDYYRALSIISSFLINQDFARALLFGFLFADLSARIKGNYRILICADNGHACVSFLFRLSWVLSHRSLRPQFHLWVLRIIVLDDNAAPHSLAARIMKACIVDYGHNGDFTWKNDGSSEIGCRATTGSISPGDGQWRLALVGDHEVMGDHLCWANAAEVVEIFKKDDFGLRSIQ